MAASVVAMADVTIGLTKVVCEDRLNDGCGGFYSSLVNGAPLGLGPNRVNLKCTRRWQKLRVCASDKNRSESESESDDKNLNEGDKGSVDWDKAWETFPKPKKQNSFSIRSLFNVDMDKYVTRRPTPSRFPLSEETDPLRRTERAALDAWTDSKFTLAGVGVVVGLFVYMVVIVGPPPA